MRLIIFILSLSSEDIFYINLIMSFARHFVLILDNLYDMMIAFIPQPYPQTVTTLPILQLGEGERSVAIFKLIRMHIRGMGLRFI